MPKWTKCLQGEVFLGFWSLRFDYYLVIVVWNSDIFIWRLGWLDYKPSVPSFRSAPAWLLKGGRYFRQK